MENNIPSIDVNLIATTSSVLVRRELYPQLIYLMAQTLQEEHGGAGVFQHAGEFPTQTDSNFPVAEEALDYYRNGPPFLQRYLPIINYAKRIAAVLLAVVAVVIPVFTHAPRLYASFIRTRMARLYRRLRAVEIRLQKNLSADKIVALQTDLENINQAANVLPMRHSELFFALIGHVDLLRTRLAARLVELRAQSV